MKTIIRKQNNVTRRVMALVLSLTMCLGFLPGTAQTASAAAGTGIVLGRAVLYGQEPVTSALTYHLPEATVTAARMGSVMITLESDVVGNDLSYDTTATYMTKVFDGTGTDRKSRTYIFSPSSESVLAFSSSELQSILRGLKITVKPGSKFDLTVSATVTKLTSAEVANIDGKPHFYKFINSAGIKWFDAYVAAKQKPLFGMRGYLATITSAGENTQIKNLVGTITPGWIGATSAYASDGNISDKVAYANAAAMRGKFTLHKDVNGALNGNKANYYWACGPESWAALYCKDGYNNWAVNQPDASATGDGEHFVQYGLGGLPEWNDLADDPTLYAPTVTKIDGYYVEWGGYTSDQTQGWLDDPASVRAVGSYEAVVQRPEPVTTFSDNGTVTIAPDPNFPTGEGDYELYAVWLRKNVAATSLPSMATLTDSHNWLSSGEAQWVNANLRKMDTLTFDNFAELEKTFQKNGGDNLSDGTLYLYQKVLTGQHAGATTLGPIPKQEDFRSVRMNPMDVRVFDQDDTPLTGGYQVEMQINNLAEYTKPLGNIFKYNSEIYINFTPPSGTYCTDVSDLLGGPYLELPVNDVRKESNIYGFIRKGGFLNITVTDLLGQVNHAVDGAAMKTLSEDPNFENVFTKTDTAWPVPVGSEADTISLTAHAPYTALTPAQQTALFDRLYGIMARTANGGTASAYTLSGFINSFNSLVELQKQVNSAAGKAEADYTAVSWAAMQTKLTAAQGLLSATGKDSLSVSTVSTAARELAAALAALELKSSTTVTVKGVDAANTVLYTYTTALPAESTAETVTAFTQPKYRLDKADIAVGAGSAADAVITAGAVTVDATKGSQTVTFHYVSNMADVTIQALYDTDKTTPVPGVAAFKLPAEIGTEFTYTAPSISGYTNKGSSMTDNKITVAAGTNTISFYYTKDAGNVTFKAVDAAGTELGTYRYGTTLAVGGAAPIAPANAPKITNYALANSGADGTPDHASYDGMNDITVTFVYAPKTKAITVEAVNADTGVQLGTQTLSRATGQKHTITAPTKSEIPALDGYTVKLGDSKEVYVVDNTDAMTVTFYYSAVSPAAVTVELYYNDGTSDHTIQSYTVPGVFGVEMAVAAPTLTGYTFTSFDGGTNGKITPTVAGPNTVRLRYTAVERIITVELKDASAAALTAPAGFATSYTVKQGDGFTVTAPSIPGYTLASGETIVKSLTTAEIEAGTRTVTFTYEKVADALYVRHTVIGQAGSTELFRYVAMVEKGTGSDVTYTASHLPGYAPDAETKVLPDDASGTVTFNYTENAASIKLVAVDNGTSAPLPGMMPIVLTGYRAGQTVKVAAPAVTDKVLVGSLTKEVTLTAGENQITFPYVNKNAVTFTLTDKDTGKVIRVINATLNGVYNPETAGNELDLSGEFYTYVRAGSDADFVAGGDKITITDVTTAKGYVIMYSKKVRDVNLLFVEKGNESNQIGTETNLGAARVGETYVAAAKQFPGWMLGDDLKKAVPVPDEAGALEIKFLYEKKLSGDVTVTYKSGSTQLMQYTAFAAVGEDFTAAAPAAYEKGKYTLDGDVTRTVRVGTVPQVIIFEYNPNFVTVSAYTEQGGTETFLETHEVAKNGALNMNPPSLGGMILKGITAGTDGSATTFPIYFQNNVLKLTSLSADAKVVFHYQKVEDVIPEYQVTLTVKEQYGTFALGTRSTTYTKGGPNETVRPSVYSGYTLKSYKLDGVENTNLTGFTGVTVDLAANHTVEFLYTRADGSAAVPGGDGTLGNGDDVIVYPGDMGTPPTVGGDGTITVPDDSAKVTTPGGDLYLPGGTTVKPDGTITLPDGTTTLDPTAPTTPAGYYKVAYRANGGSGTMPTQIVKDGEKTKALANGFARGNYAFADWNIREDGTGTAYAVGAEITGTITLYARWTPSAMPHTAKVVFHKNVGGAEKEEQILGGYSDTQFTAALKANTFVVTGWSLNGWNTVNKGGGTAYADGQTVTLHENDEWNLYAQWVKKSGNGSVTVPGGDLTPGTGDDVTVNGSGTDKPTLNPDGTVDVPSGGSVTTPDGTITLPGGGTVTPDGTITAKPDGTPVKPGDPVAGYYQLTYLPGGGSGAKHIVLVKNTDDATAANSLFTYAGHIFAGWKSNAGALMMPGAALTGKTDMTLTATWFVQGGDGSITVPGGDTTPGTGDDVTVKPNPGDPTKKPEVDGDGNVTVPDGGSVVTPGGEIVPPGGSVVKPDGSIELPGGGGTIDPADPAAPLPAGYVAVVYHSNNGLSETLRQVVAQGSSVTLLASSWSKPGMTFDGWNTTADGTGTAHTAGSSVTASANLAFYAKWRSGGTIVYTAEVTFHANKATVGDETRKQQLGSADSSMIASKLYPNSFALTGWTFGGWFTGQSGTGTYYKNGGDVVLPNGGTLDLYATWYRDNGDGTVTVPGPDGIPGTGDDMTGGKGTGVTNPTPDGKGNITIPDNGEITLPGGKVELPNGGTLAPNGDVTIKEGDTANMPNGDTVIGPAVIHPDGTVTGGDESAPRREGDGTITLPGPDGKLDTADDVTVKPDKDAGGVDHSTISKDTGVVTLPDGGAVDYPTSPKTTATVPDGTKVNPDGSLVIPEGGHGTLNPGGKDLPGGTEIDADGSVYWIVKVSLMSGGTVLSAPAGFQSSRKAKNGSSVTITAPAISDYLITGSGAQTVTVLNAMTVTFQYEKPATGGGTGGGGGGGITYYALTFEANGGSAVEAVTKSGGAKVTLDQKTTREGYLFTGWYTDKALTQLVETVTLRGNMTVYAGWEKNTSTENALDVDFSGGYMIGGEGGLFRPDTGMTRAEVAMAFYRLMGDQSMGDQSGSFADVNEGDWYAVAVATLASRGILTGYQGMFRPNDTITRAEFTTIVARFVEESTDAAAMTFHDVPAIHWAAAYIAKVSGAGLVQGVGGGNFAPDRTVTRAEAVKMVNALLGWTPDRAAMDEGTGVKIIPDVAPSHWAYYEIQLAVNGRQ